MNALAAMYVKFLPEQRVYLERYFASVRDLKVRIDDLDVAIAGGTKRSSATPGSTTSSTSRPSGRSTSPSV
jgi:hypothetical protein